MNLSFLPRLAGTLQELFRFGRGALVYNASAKKFEFREATDDSEALVGIEAKEIILPDGAGAGKYLVSDAIGKGTWSALNVTPGHTIQQAGISRTQRERLNFIGASVEDDSSNNATIIRIEGGGGSGPTPGAGGDLEVDVSLDSGEHTASAFSGGVLAFDESSMVFYENDFETPPVFGGETPVGHVFDWQPEHIRILARHRGNSPRSFHRWVDFGQVVEAPIFRIKYQARVQSTSAAWGTPRNDSWVCMYFADSTQDARAQQTGIAVFLHSGGSLSHRVMQHGSSLVTVSLPWDRASGTSHDFEVTVNLLDNIVSWKIDHFNDTTTTGSYVLENPQFFRRVDRIATWASQTDNNPYWTNGWWNFDDLVIDSPYGVHYSDSVAISGMDFASAASYSWEQYTPDGSSVRVEYRLSLDNMVSWSDWQTIAASGDPLSLIKNPTNVQFGYLQFRHILIPDPEDPAITPTIGATKLNVTERVIIPLHTGAIEGLGIDTLSPNSAVVYPGKCRDDEDRFDLILEQPYRLYESDVQGGIRPGTVYAVWMYYDTHHVEGKIVCVPEGAPLPVYQGYPRRRIGYLQAEKNSNKFVQQSTDSASGKQRVTRYLSPIFVDLEGVQNANLTLALPRTARSVSGYCKATGDLSWTPTTESSIYTLPADGQFSLPLADQSNVVALAAAEPTDAKLQITGYREVLSFQAFSAEDPPGLYWDGDNWTYIWDFANGAGVFGSPARESHSTLPPPYAVYRNGAWRSIYIATSTTRRTCMTIQADLGAAYDLTRIRFEYFADPDQHTDGAYATIDSSATTIRDDFYNNRTTNPLVTETIPQRAMARVIEWTGATALRWIRFNCELAKTPATSWYFPEGDGRITRVVIEGTGACPFGTAPAAEETPWTVEGSDPSAWYDFDDKSTLFSNDEKTALAGENDDVAVWADKSGNDLDMAPMGAHLKPYISRHGVSFSADACLQTVSTTEIGDEFTLAIAWRPGLQFQQWEQLFGVQIDNNGVGPSLANGNTANRVSFVRAQGGSHGWHDSNRHFWRAPTVVMATRKDGVSRLYWFDTEVLNWTAAHSTGVNHLSISGRTSRPIRGDVYEAIYWDRGMEYEEIQAVNNYLEKKWIGELPAIPEFPVILDMADPDAMFVEPDLTVPATDQGQGIGSYANSGSMPEIYATQPDSGRRPLLHIIRQQGYGVANWNNKWMRLTHLQVRNTRLSATPSDRWTVFWMGRAHVNSGTMIGRSDGLTHDLLLHFSSDQLRVHLGGGQPVQTFSNFPIGMYLLGFVWDGEILRWYNGFDGRQGSMSPNNAGVLHGEPIIINGYRSSNIALMLNSDVMSVMIADYALTEDQVETVSTYLRRKYRFGR